MILLSFPYTGVFFWADFSRFQWVLLGFTESKRVFIRVEWVSWHFTKFSRLSLGFNRFYWVLLGFNGFYWVSLGFTGFYLVLLGFHGLP